MSQKSIERVLGMSHTMFKHICALNTYTEPFLSMRANDQRDLIEQLLGITQLSEKADILKELIRISKDKIQEETFRIKGVEEANAMIGKSITDLERRQRIWSQKKTEKINDFSTELRALEHIDIDAELEAHVAFAEFNEKKSKTDAANKWIANIELSTKKQEKVISKLEAEIKLLEEHTCYACGQEMHDDKQESILAAKEEQKTEASLQVTSNSSQLTEHLEVISSIGELGVAPRIEYNTVQEASEHQNKMQQTQTNLSNAELEEDPYYDQIDTLKNTGLQELDWSEVNRLTELKEHQDFLLKLLTNKDSFIRKKIIEQNLQFLNTRLEYYITRLGLPHEVQFQSDLNVTITQLGQDLDFDNLSRGERNRLILGLSWSFRDVFESMNHPINFMAIDELVDSGMDTVGVESALGVLKKIRT